MPGRLFECIGKAYQNRFAECISCQLQADRQIILDKPHRHSNRRETGVRCNMLAVVTMRRIEVADEPGRITPCREGERIQPVLIEQRANATAE